MPHSRKDTARTPLFAALRRAWRLAERGPDAGPAPAGKPLDRRAFLGRALAGAAAAAAWTAEAGLASGAWARPMRRDRAEPRVVVVGAGLAGLACAYALKKAGVRATVYEAGGRAGGRVFTVHGVLGDGLYTELGAEFINSDHQAILGLAREFGLALLDLRGPTEQDLLREVYLFGGERRTEREVADALRPLLERLGADLERLPDRIDYRTRGFARRLDRLSLADYLDRVGAAGWPRKLLEVAYVTEFGLETGEQSALNLLTSVSGATGGSYELVAGDERYRISGGNQQIPAELARRLAGQVRLGHHLEAVGPRGPGLALTFRDPGGRRIDVPADVAVLAIPFSVLRGVAIRLALPPRKRQAIRELGYGTNSKYVLGVSRRVWREQGCAGFLYSDGAVQSAWDNSRQGGGAAGGMTVFQGGRAGMALDHGADAELTARFGRDLDAAFPGTIAAHNGRALRWNWPHDPLARGSYACMRPGQWTSILGSEGEPVGNLLFAGEHAGGESSGFMDGAVASGLRAARQVLSRVRARDDLRRRGAVIKRTLGLDWLT